MSNVARVTPAQPPAGTPAEAPTGFQVSLPTFTGPFDLLQEDDVGFMPPDFRERGAEIDGRPIRIGIVPRLPKLHVELENAEGAHAARSLGRSHDATNDNAGQRQCVRH